MIVQFRDKDRLYIKQWPNWTGVVPQIGDTIALHFGDYNEEERIYKVTDRLISGTTPDKVYITLEHIETINLM